MGKGISKLYETNIIIYYKHEMHNIWNMILMFSIINISVSVFSINTMLLNKIMTEFSEYTSIKYMTIPRNTKCKCVLK